MSMATHTIRKFAGIGRFLVSHRPSLTRCYSLYTPDYLMTGKSKIPLYATLNIQIKGYTFPVLENYQKYISMLADTLALDIDDSWALPPRIHKIQRFKSNSTVVVTEFEVMQYERNIQMPEVSAIQYPILLRTLEASLPEGVTLKVEYFNPLYENKRYIPDRELLDLKGELESMQRS